MTDTAIDPTHTGPAPSAPRNGAGLTPVRAATEEAFPDDAVVRELALELARRGSELPRSDAGDQQTLLDVQVGEVRCVLTHLPMRENRCAVAQRLSPREAEIVRLVGAGHTNKTIAAVLDISLYTVSTHLRRIFAKLGVSTRAAMVAAASSDLEA
ncbi:LuxR C-terminal-related transcriptional regulator [Streptomyces sp. NPDC001401]|uniref:helix-turn-helix transcriptional regulator n=1 Tax=Streptomyces sp. NPDC001401 TaxID=3364570 RepID=UPI0036867AB1